MTALLLTIFYLLFSVLAWRRLPWAVLFTIVALPTYLVRFQIGWLPFTLLEGLIIIVTAVWLAKKYFAHRQESGIRNRESWVALIRKSIIHNSSFIIPLTLFFVASTVSMFIAPDLRAAAGVWKAYFLEPILFFLVLRDLLNSRYSLQTASPKSQYASTKLQTNHKSQATNLKFKNWNLFGNWRLEIGNLSAQQIVAALGLSIIIPGLFAIYQKFTGTSIPNPFWAAEETRRVTSFYGYPNAIGLYFAPIAMLLLVYGAAHLKLKKPLVIGHWLLATIALGAIVFAVSKGALLGIFAGIIFLALFWKGYRLIFTGFIVAALIAGALNPQFRTLTGTPTVEGGGSLEIRTQQWSEAWQMLKDRPVLGAGLSGYQTRVAPFHKKGYIEIFMYPHNIVLNFWNEMGLLGLIAFVWLLVIFYKHGFHTLKRLEIGNWKLEIAAMSAMLALLIHGLLDVPYFKNDLAMLFWIIFALGLTNAQKSEMIKS